MNDRKLMTMLSRYRDGLECKDCGGSGTVSVLADSQLREHKPPKLELCPTCAPWRALDLCWHEPDGMTWICGHCKTDVGWRTSIKDAVHVETLNPDLTLAMHGHIPLIVHWLMVLGLWNEFVEWHDMQCHANISHPMAIAYTWEVISRPALYASAEILINGVYRRDAIGSFMQGRD